MKVYKSDALLYETITDWLCRSGRTKFNLPPFIVHADIIIYYKNNDVTSTKDIDSIIFYFE